MENLGRWVGGGVGLSDFSAVERDGWHDRLFYLLSHSLDSLSQYHAWHGSSALDVHQEYR